MEGDTADDDTAIQLESAFLSTPSGWRATLPYRFGRRICEFLSTPSGWRATAQSFRKSIALRLYFYPRPPGGGRPTATNFEPPVPDFYPRPPGGGRLISGSQSPPRRYFYPRPPGGGRPYPAFIHKDFLRFLSTPSGWRATAMDMRKFSAAGVISIHALRVEGDLLPRVRHLCERRISIHALRVEGDTSKPIYLSRESRFLSTPSGWRATARGLPEVPRKLNFYPRPPGGGRRCSRKCQRRRKHFYPRPPGGGRPSQYVR